MRTLTLAFSAVLLLAVLSSPAQRAISATVSPTSSGTEAGPQPAVTGTPLSVARVLVGDTSMPAPLRGKASWYRAAPGIAAAGPALRRALGRHWRGSIVTVCARACVRVTVSDFCQCYRGTKGERLIDLGSDSFARLAPLAVGVLAVSVSVPGPIVPPATDR